MNISESINYENHHFNQIEPHNKYCWQGPIKSLAFERKAFQEQLMKLDIPVYVVLSNGQVGITHQGICQPIDEEASPGSVELLAYSHPIPPEMLGDKNFRDCYSVKYAAYAGAMAHGISSENMVITLGKAGFLCAFGSANMVPSRLEAAIQHIQSELPTGPYAFNLIYSPGEQDIERRTVELFLKYKVRVVEVSAFLSLTPNIVYYRVSGLDDGQNGQILINNRIIVKCSRTEIASKFMQPAPLKILDELLANDVISKRQYELAQKVPMADDVTVEADSGGHTDKRPLVCLLPTMLALRDEIQQKYRFQQPVRVGAGGGISTPSSALAAFMMGAAYIVTGSVNQACIEAGTSDHTRSLLCETGMADVTMAPSASMFEMGVKVQVLKKGTFFPLRAQKLYDIYTKYNSIEDIPHEERQKIEQQIFKDSLENVWKETIQFFMARDNNQIKLTEINPKQKMALIFRWYLGQASHWSISGTPDREMDYQIWCGPSMGTFNDWVRGTYLEKPGNRRVVDVNAHILTGCAYQYRIQNLRYQGVQIPAEMATYVPLPISFVIDGG